MTCNFDCADIRCSQVFCVESILVSLVIETLHFEKLAEPIFLRLRGVEVQLSTAEAIWETKSDWIEVLLRLRILFNCSEHDMHMLEAVACSLVIFLRLLFFLNFIATSEFVEVELSISNLKAKPLEFVCFGFQEALIYILKGFSKARNCLVRGWVWIWGSALVALISWIFGGGRLCWLVCNRFVGQRRCDSFWSTKFRRCSNLLQVQANIAGTLPVFTDCLKIGLSSASPSETSCLVWTGGWWSIHLQTLLE